MCYGIALAGCEIPTELTGHPGLPRRAFQRGKQDEFRFLWADRRPCLPVLRDGRLFLARWGNSRRQSRFLPRTGWTWLATVNGGGWRESGAIPVDIPATLGLERGRWYRITQGIRGLLVPDERGMAVVYMICEPASHYYRVMTGSERMPVFIEQRI
jgi:hypothetical protein